MWDFILWKQTWTSCSFGTLLGSSRKKRLASSFKNMLFRKVYTYWSQHSDDKIGYWLKWKYIKLRTLITVIIFFSELLSKIKAIHLILLPFYICFCISHIWWKKAYTHARSATLQQNNPYSYLIVHYVILSSDNIIVMWSDKCWINHLYW